MKMKIVAIVILLILTAGSVVFFNKQHSQQATHELTLYGNIDIREVQLTVNASEHIAQIFVQEGDRVKKGQLLANLNTDLLEARLAETEALLLEQQQTVDKLKAGSREHEIAKVKAEYAAAKSQATTAQDTAKRLQKLLPNKLASEDDVETAQAKADAAIAQADAMAHALALAVEGPRQEDIAIAEAQLKAKQASVMIAKQHLQDASLYSPADGVIRNRILEPGDMATPQSTILTLAMIDPVWVRAYVPETDLGKIAIGFKAQIFSDSFPDKFYQGWIGYLSPTAEFTPKNVQTPELRARLVYSLRVYACNPQDELRLGMPVTVKIPLNQDVKAATPHRCESIND